MITFNEYFEKCPPPRAWDMALVANLADLLTRMNALRQIYGKPMIVNSGYRSQSHNTAVGGSRNSHHMTCAAIDIADDEKGTLFEWVKANLDVIGRLGLWVEERQGKWVHFQIYPPKSGNRIFKP